MISYPKQVKVAKEAQHASEDACDQKNPTLQFWQFPVVQQKFDDDLLLLLIAEQS